MAGLKKAYEDEYTEEWESVLSYNIFLLEKELGYQINKDTNGILLIERLKMLERFCKEQQEQMESSNKGKSKGRNKKTLK
jgi:hypothetical protein